MRRELHPPPTATNKPSGTLTFGQAVPITSLSPQGFQPEGYPSGYEAAFAIYNGLVRFNRHLGISPSLATRWSVSSNGLTWTFHLRHGVKFQDGTPFGAQAVVRDFNQMINPQADTGAYVLWKPVTSITAVNSDTVQITTSKPYAALLDVLAHGSGLIPSPTAVKKWGAQYPLHPVGTGPYKLKTFDPGTDLVLTANTQYWGGAPKVATLVFKAIPSSQSRIAALQSGQVDLVDGIPAQDVATLSSSPGITVKEVTSLQTFTIALNEANPALQSPAVRQALNYAVNKSSLISAIFDGHATQLNSPLASNTPGHVTVGSYHYNLSKADQLLSSAGWHKGSNGIRSKNGQALTFTMLVPNTAFPNGVTLSQAIQAQLKQAGVAVKLDVVPTASFWGMLRQPASKQTFSMALWAFNPSFVAGSLQMEDEFLSNPSSNRHAPAIWNYIWYHNARVDQAILTANQTVNATQATPILGQAETTVWNQAAYIWLFAPQTIIAERSTVKGVKLLPNTFTLVQNVSHP